MQELKKQAMGERKGNGQRKKARNSYVHVMSQGCSVVVAEAATCEIATGLKLAAAACINIYEGS